MLFCISAVLLIAEERIQKHSNVVDISQAVLEELEYRSLVVCLDQAWADKVDQAALNLGSAVAQMAGFDSHTQCQSRQAHLPGNKVECSQSTIMSQEQPCPSGTASCGFAGIPGMP